MVITIDGPAGTGKSSVALAVAERLGFDFLDTGAMYRAIGVAALRKQINLEDARELAFVARHTRIEYDFTKHPPGVLMNGEPVGHLLRGADATRAASYVAVVPAIREVLVRQQQEIGRSRPNLVTEGRDQGTIVFPNAELKFYLDATPAERARRRVQQLRARGEIVDYQEILNQIEARDQRDKSRSVGPLSVPADAEVVDTTSLSQAEVIEHIVERANAAGAAAAAATRPTQGVAPMKPPHPLWKLAQVIVRVSTSVVLDLKVYGRENVPDEGGALLISNHQSYLDPAILGAQLPRPMSYLAKSDLWKNPVFGWLISKLYAFPVRQGAGDVGAIKETISRLREGHLLNIFPEGSRTQDGELLPIQAGVALVIRKAGVPVVPAVVDGSFLAWPKGRMLPGPHRVRVLFGKPLRMDDMKPKEIIAEVDRLFREMLAELRAKES